MRWWFSTIAVVLVTAWPLGGDGHGADDHLRGAKRLATAASAPADTATARHPMRRRPPRARVTVTDNLVRPELARLDDDAVPNGPLKRRTRRTRVRELLLTFDDGPDLEGTPQVLEELDRRGFKAIFFVNGQHLVGNKPNDFDRRELVRQIASRGHLVGNHTLSHRNVCAEPALLESEIDANAEIIAATTGVRPTLFRSPYGAQCRALRQALAARDLIQVGWNLDPQEWRSGSKAATVQYVTSRLAQFGGRAILLLHDTRRGAVAALPEILDWIVRENERMVRTRGPEIVVRDYSVLMPATPLPESGLEPFVHEIGRLPDWFRGLLGGHGNVVLGMR